MNQIVFRQAQQTELPAIIALLVDDELGQHREDASFPLNQCYIDAFNAILADPNQLQVVAVYDNVVVGTLQLSFIPGLARQGSWRGLIEGVRISSSHRGTGLGEQMFKWAIAQCKARGCHLVQLTTDKSRPDAHRFYDKLGFTASHIGYKLAI